MKYKYNVRFVFFFLYKTMFSVLSFNVLAQEWADPAYYPLIKAIPDAATRRQRNVAIITKYNTTVVLLQEVEKKEWINQEIPGYTSVYFPYSKNKATIGTMMFMKENWHSLDTANLNTKRMVGQIGLTLVGDIGISIQNAHIDWTDREVEIAGLRDDPATMVVGDFNAVTSEIADNIVSSQFLANAFADNTVITFHGTDSKPIDHMLYDTRILQPVTTYVPTCSGIVECFKVYGSDHVPIIATFQIICKLKT